MKKLLLTLLLLPTLLLGQQSPPTFVNTVANDGPNAVTYKSFKINDYANNNNQSEYNAHPTNSAGFDAMFDYANKNTTTWTHWGRDTATKAFTWPWSNVLPRHLNNNFGWIIEGYFLPSTSGTYRFQLNSDDRSDFWFDENDNGTITNSGITMGNGSREVDFTLTAGVSYKFRIRYEQGAGGASLYLKWKSPEDTAAGADFAFNANSIYSIDADNYVEPLHYDVNYKFRNLDETGFSINTYYEVSSSEIAKNSNSNTISLDGNGEASISSQVDVDLVGQGKYDITATPGNVEWVVIYAPMVTNKYKYRIGLDVREFPSGVDLDDINNIELLDLVDTGGTSSYFGQPGYANSWATTSSDQYWNNFNYWTWSTIPFSSSNYSSSIRSASGYHALKVELNFTEVTSYKTQYVVFDSPTTSELHLLVDDIITVSDVYIAFKELTNRGIGMNESGNEFVYGIQYSNSDLDRNGIFDYNDTYMMLDWLNGGTLFDTSYLSAIMRLIDTNTYNSISSTTWNGFTTKTRYPLNLVNGTMNYTSDVSVSWLGDVNLSHSPIPTSNLSVTGKFTQSRTKKSGDVESLLTTELNGENVVVKIKLNPLHHQIMGTQYRLAFDKSILTYETIESTSNYNNFTSVRDGYLNFGSIITNGEGVLNSTTEYTITFKTNKQIKDMLGLVAITKSEAVNKEGVQLDVQIK